MSEQLPDLDDLAKEKRTASDGLEERGQGAGRLLGEGAEQSIAGEEDAERDPDPEHTPDGSREDDHQADES